MGLPVFQSTSLLILLPQSLLLGIDLLLHLLWVIINLFSHLHVLAEVDLFSIRKIIMNAFNVGLLFPYVLQFDMSSGHPGKHAADHHEVSAEHPQASIEALFHLLVPPCARWHASGSANCELIDSLGNSVLFYHDLVSILGSLKRFRLSINFSGRINHSD